MASIPVANLQDFYHPERRQIFVETIGDALVDIGFFALEGHGIDSKLIRGCYEIAEDFFVQSDEEKEKYEDLALKGQRGFTSFGRESAKGRDVPDLKEFWHVGRESFSRDVDRSTYPENLWPQNQDSFRESFNQLYSALDKCSLDLLKACSLYINAKENYFSEMAEDGNSILRVIHYPPVADDVNPASVRAAAHEDINFITLLCEATDSGLELQNRDGSWRAIDTGPGQIIVDSGDMLQNLTNGFFKSTTHRVVNPNNSRSRRFSMPFFVHPRSEVDLSPCGPCVEKTGGEKKFPDMTAGQYLAQRLKELGL
jgi:isopenicillin N synthase-like dioxygenase